MPHSTPYPEFEVLDSDAWVPEWFDPGDQRVRDMALAWTAMRHDLHRQIAFQILHTLTALWFQGGPYRSMDASGLAHATGFAEGEVAFVLEYMTARRMVKCIPNMGGYRLLYENGADFHEAFDARFPGVRDRPEPEERYEPAPGVVHRLSEVEQKQRATFGTVYLLESGGRYKIGVTRNLKRRLHQLSGKQAAFPIRLVHSVDGDGYEAFESSLHDLFDDERCHGEWFELSDEDVAEAVQYMNSWASGGAQ